jgi:hypothetical protein
MQFRTAVHNPWHDWDHELLGVLRRYAKRLVVRVPGLISLWRFNGRYRPDELRIRQWEAYMKFIFGKPKAMNTAFVILPFRIEPDKDDPYVPSASTLVPRQWTLEHWVKFDRLHHRLDMMLYELRQAIGDVPLLLHVEDWSARWMMLCDFIPTYWLMDNPFIGRHEALDLWSSKLTRPGLLRHSPMSLMRYWRNWRMHITKDELIAAHLPLSLDQHGTWYGVQRPHRVKSIDPRFGGTKPKFEPITRIISRSMP